MQEHPITQPSDLPADWRARAQLLRDWGGDPQLPKVWELAATELDHALAAGGDEALSLVEAAEESGYSTGYLGSLVRKGKIPNAGRRHAPRIRRSHLPHKKPSKPGRPPTRRQKTVEQIADARALNKMTHRR